MFPPSFPQSKGLIDRLGLDYPILQAPAGSTAGPELAAAVSAAGALGALALTWCNEDSAAQMVHAVRKRTARLFQVNFVLAFPTGILTTALDKVLDAALDAGAPVVTFSWGDPSSLVPRVRQFNAALGIQVTSVLGARRAVQLGPDFVICQGVQAGGHVQATRPLEDVLPEVIDECGTIPVIAAGGLGNGQHIRTVLDQGAAGAMLGTRFVASRESQAHPEYKAALVRADGFSAVLTVCYDGAWPHAPHRVLLNSTLEDWEAAGCPPPGLRPGEGDVVATSATGARIPRYDDASALLGTTGDVLGMALYAGTSCGTINDIPTAAELVSRLWRECEKAGDDEVHSDLVARHPRH